MTNPIKNKGVAFKVNMIDHGDKISNGTGEILIYNYAWKKVAGLWEDLIEDLGTKNFSMS